MTSQLSRFQPSALLLSLIGLLLTPSLALAEVLTVGHSLTAFTLEDQFEQPQKVDSGDTLLLFAADMDAADIVKAAYAEGEIDPFVAADIRYVADISGMPSLIASMFAKPKMRDYPFVIVLDEEGDITANWPHQAEQLTVIKLDQLQIVEVGFCADVACLTELVTEMTPEPATLSPSH